MSKSNSCCNKLPTLKYFAYTFVKLTRTLDYEEVMQYNSTREAEVRFRKPHFHAMQKLSLIR